MASNASIAKLIQGRETFIFQVYLILAIQLVVTFSIYYVFKDNEKVSNAVSMWFWPMLLVWFLLVIVMVLPGISIPIKLALFTSFAIIKGMFLLKWGEKYHALFQRALFGTIAVFAAMTAFAIVISSYGVDLSWMGFYLFAALIGLVVAMLIELIVVAMKSPSDRKPSPWFKVLVAFSLVLFSIYVAYDTNLMLTRNDRFDTPVDAALRFYIDFINIFNDMTILQSGGSKS